MALVTSKSSPCLATSSLGFWNFLDTPGLKDVVTDAPQVSAPRSDSEDPAPPAAKPIDLKCKSFASLSRKSSAGRPSFAAPKVWMMIFGVVLAVCAGIVDVVVWRGLHVFVSHVTGNMARIGMRIEGVVSGTHEPWDLFHIVLVVSSFVFGSFLCGLVIPKNQVHFGGKSFYGVALLGNSCLLFAAGFVAPSAAVHDEEVKQAHAIAAGCLAAMACGLQNAMCTMHFGAIVRTTHITGTATDIGSTAGRAATIMLRSGCARRRATAAERVEILDEITKLCVLLPILIGFLCGAIIGAFLHSAVGISALFVPATVTGTTGFLYAFFRAQIKRQLKRLEDWQMHDDLLEMESAISRASSLLEIAGRTPRHKGKDLGSLDQLLGQSRRVMQDVAAFAELYSELDAAIPEAKSAWTV